MFVLNIAANVHSFLISEYERQQRRILSDSEMKRFIIKLSKSYVDSKKLRNSETVDLNDVRYQAAYLFQYFTVLCHSVGYGIEMLDESRQRPYNRSSTFGSVMLDIADKKMKTINVCSIGGGPGTDVLGLHIYLQSFLRNNGIDEDLFINATVIDKHENWNLSWDAIHQYLEPIHKQQIRVAQYIGYDISTPVPEEVLSSVMKADVILLWKFVSAVKGLPRFEKNLKAALCKAPTDSYLIYGDNLEGGNTEIFARIAKEAGFEEIAAEGEMDFKPIDEGSYTMEDLELRYDRRYQQTLSMYFMIMEKKN